MDSLGPAPCGVLVSPVSWMPSTLIKACWPGLHVVEVDDVIPMLGGKPEQAVIGAHGLFPLHRAEGAGPVVDAPGYLDAEPVGAPETVYGWGYGGYFRSRTRIPRLGREPSGNHDSRHLAGCLLLTPGCGSQPVSGDTITCRIGGDGHDHPKHSPLLP